MTRRYVVTLIPGLSRGQRRWVVWDRERKSWADDAQVRERHAKDIARDLESKR